MIRIGLTGVSGSGKSFVTKVFEKHGVLSINADTVVHELYASKNPCTEAIAHLFGEDILTSQHSVNRQKLASIVFASQEKLLLLNQTVHPFVISKVKEAINENERQGVQAFLIEAPQLFEAGLQDLCDYIISVIADHRLRVERLIARDGISQDMVEKRIFNQHDDLFFRENSDFCIVNNGVDDLEEQVCVVLTKMGLLI